MNSAHRGERIRATQACEHCRAHKVKCTGSLPCQRCIARSEICSYTAKEACQNSTNNTELETAESYGDRVQELHVEVTESEEMQIEPFNDAQGSISSQLPPRPTGVEPSVAAQLPLLTPASAETTACPSQQLDFHAESEGSQWLNCNGFERFEATQEELFSPSLFNQWQSDFYEPPTNFSSWLTASQVMLPATHSCVCFN